MLKYIIGFFKNLFNPAVSILAIIDQYSVVSKKAKIHIGAKVFNSTIDSYTYLTKGSSAVYAEIGKFCSVGHESKIGLAHHTLDKLSSSPIFTEKFNATGFKWVDEQCEFPYRKVIIGNDVWIGSRVMIMGGIKVGDGAVIAAGSIVTKDVPDYAVVAGIPAQIKKYRFEKVVIDTLLKIKWWDFPEKELISKIRYFNKTNINDAELKTIFPMQQLNKE